MHNAVRSVPSVLPSVPNHTLARIQDCIESICESRNLKIAVLFTCTSLT